MSYNKRQRSFIEQFQNDLFRDWEITRDDLLQNTERGLKLREAHNKELAQFIATNPQIFDRDQINTSQKVKNTPIRELETFKLGDAAGVFFSEAGNQAQRVNPFSELNQTALWIVGGLAIVTISAVVAYRVTPKVPVKK